MKTDWVGTEIVFGDLPTWYPRDASVPVCSPTPIDSKGLKYTL